MLNSKSSAILIGLILALLPGMSVMADDTELYTNNSAAKGGKPLVMFSIDYSPNTFATMCNATTDSDCKTLESEGFLSHVGDVTKVKRNELLVGVLRKVLGKLGGMRVGIMMPHADTCKGTLSGCSNGGYIMMGFNDIDTAGVKDDFYNKLMAIPDPADLSWASGSGSITHAYQPKEMFFEFFRYLTGQDVQSGHLGFDDLGYTQPTKGSLDNLNDFYGDIMRDISSDVEPGTSNGTYDTASTYKTPLSDDCSKIFTVNFTFNAGGGADNTLDSEINDTKANQGMDDIGLSGKNNNFETVLKFLQQTDLADATDVWGSAPDLEGKQNVTSFFITDTNMKSTGNSWAAAGGSTAAYIWEKGKADKLVNDLTSIFNQILSVSTTFTAASVPVSVLNRAQVIDNVYIALFKADPNGKKRWPGNMKKLKLNLTDGLLEDATGNFAIGSDGRIKESALTYWTKADELPAPDTSVGEIAGKDGRAVMRGGSGQQIPGFMSGTAGVTGDPGTANAGTGARQLYYYNGSALADLDVTTGVADDLWRSLQVTDPATDSYADVEKTLQYIRGYDVNDEDGDSNFKEARDWMAGDPLHSRPLPINYGSHGSFTDSNPDIRIVFGGNDGFFRMVQNTDSSGGQKGVENWAFMPQEVMGMIKEVRDNKIDPLNHPYGVDGAPAMYYYDSNNDNKIVKTDANGDQVWVFFGLRRGGRGYYALDVTDPDNPTFLWKITNSTTGFSNLGYSFAQPRVGLVNYDGTGAKPVVMFSGGYDKQKDTTSTSGDTMGNAIYMVDAKTGALVWKAEKGASNANVSTTEYNHKNLIDSIPSTLTTIDTVGDGVMDRAYVGDTGGRVWRVDFSGNDRTKWYVKLLAELGTKSGANDRRFFHRPDFVQYRDSGDYDAVIISSGNRADPLDLRPVGSTVENYLYVIKDRVINTGALTVSASDAGVAHADLYDTTSNCLQSDSCTLTTTETTQMSKGWKMKFAATGEKSLATPTTLAKKIFATTFLPPGSGSGGSCEPDEGSGRLYVVSLDDATAVNDYSVDNGDSLGAEDRFTELKSGGIPAEVVYVPFNRVLKPDLTIEEVGVSGRWKTYWYKAEY